MRLARIPARPLVAANLTASIGLGRWCRGMTAGELLLAADGALYEDKRARDLAS